MPILGLQTQSVNFTILEDNDPKTITLQDKSVYFGTPEKPLVEVLPPGYTGRVEFEYTPNSIITIDSDLLQLSFSAGIGSTTDLPDGVYQIALKFCPYSEFYLKKCYLKTSLFLRDFECFLLKFNPDCCEDVKKLKSDIIDIEILILSAKAEVGVCNVDKATQKYQLAVKKLSALNKKLTC